MSICCRASPENLPKHCRRIWDCTPIIGHCHHIVWQHGGKVTRVGRGKTCLSTGRHIGKNMLSHTLERVTYLGISHNMSDRKQCNGISKTHEPIHNPLIQSQSSRHGIAGLSHDYLFDALSYHVDHHYSYEKVSSGQRANCHLHDLIHCMAVLPADVAIRCNL